MIYCFQLYTTHPIQASTCYCLQCYIFYKYDLGIFSFGQIDVTENEVLQGIGALDVKVETNDYKIPEILEEILEVQEVFVSYGFLPKLESKLEFRDELICNMN